MQSIKPASRRGGAGRASSERAGVPGLDRLGIGRPEVNVIHLDGRIEPRIAEELDPDAIRSMHIPLIGILALLDLKPVGFPLCYPGHKSLNTRPK